MQTQLPNQDQFVDFFRHGMKTAAEIAQASLQTSLKLQEKQLDFVRGIIEDNVHTAKGVGEASSMQELLSLQQRLAGAQVQRVAEFWTTLWQAAAQNQQELFGKIGGQVLSQAGQARDFATRSAEDVARAAANQISRGAGSIRESASAAHHGKAEHRKSA